jgi:hypothetical protein
MASLPKIEKNRRQLQQGVQTTLLGKSGVPAAPATLQDRPAKTSAKAAGKSAGPRDRGGRRRKK